MTPQEKIDYSALIEQLGGQVFDTVYFNPECTHVVVGKPNRNEKYLAAVAAGKWVLRKSYLEASREAGFFVDEASHEWGLEVPGEASKILHFLVSLLT
ncbi:PREDICTED: DNA topoisomerase 2-binding protein 1-like [Acropora digitifera]|uniref:DNA topoisomerase 2-binding protein 1-like n=1 Tax=Acropora digitifera TaxID=70779 RepID=UPI00077A9F0B|nr:PREDICTED: DNA topoisomerase 2-binding protein 1-like [Acropora digitifera]